MKNTPDLILRVQFTTLSNKYFEYINRDEAVKLNNSINLNNEPMNENKENLKQDSPLFDKPKMQSYYNYMNRDNATKVEPDIKELNNEIPDKQDKLTSAFNRNTNNMTNKEYNNTRKKSEIALKNGNKMWSVVGSFTNSFLEKNGIIKDGVLDQKELKIRVRKYMDDFIRINNFDSETFYQGNIHINTDNIHFHVAMSSTGENKKEINNKITKPNLRRSKRAMLKNFQSLENREIDIKLEKNIDLNRNVVINNLRNNLNESLEKDLFSTQLKNDTLLKSLYESLPDNQKLWRYSSNAISMREPKMYLDKIIDNDFKGTQREAFLQFNSLILKQRDNDIKHFGLDEKGKILGFEKTIYDTKMNKLRETTANAYLKTMKKYIAQDSDKSNTYLKLELLRNDLKTGNLSKRINDFKEINSEIRTIENQFKNGLIDDRSNIIQTRNLKMMKAEIAKEVQKSNSSYRIKEINLERQRLKTYLRNNPTISTKQRRVINDRIKILDEYESANRLNLKFSRTNKELDYKQKFLKKDIYNLNGLRKYIPESTLKAMRKDIIKTSDNISKLSRNSLSTVLNEKIGVFEFEKIKKQLIDQYNLKLNFIDNKIYFQKNELKIKNNKYDLSFEDKRMKKLYVERHESIKIGYDIGNRLDKMETKLSEQKTKFKIIEEPPRNIDYEPKIQKNYIRNIQYSASQIGVTLNKMVKDFAHQSRQSMIISRENSLEISDKMRERQLLKEEQREQMLVKNRGREL